MYTISVVRKIFVLSTFLAGEGSGAGFVVHKIFDKEKAIRLR